jgi:hypothetical protein
VQTPSTVPSHLVLITLCRPNPVRITGCAGVPTVLPGHNSGTQCVHAFTSFYRVIVAQVFGLLCPLLTVALTVALLVETVSWHAVLVRYPSSAEQMCFDERASKLSVSCAGMQDVYDSTKRLLLWIWVPPCALIAFDIACASTSDYLPWLWIPCLPFCAALALSSSIQRSCCTHRPAALNHVDKYSHGSCSHGDLRTRLQMNTRRSKSCMYAWIQAVIVTVYT